mmetsp:Transcript_7219/g.7579  ORF Transcript_7219/g.7579 Transcript_7219/m.7579 type:complete len:538 (-) Transcript_7219:934-2547(-)
MLRNNLIINYLPPSFRDQELKKLFQQYGNIVHSKVICSKNTAESLTYGFVMFEKEEDANKALNDVNGLSVCGKQLKVSVARPRNFGGKGCKLHISRLPSHYTWEMVNNLFSQFGEIIELRLLVNQDGNSRQVAFIQYSNREESDAAMSAMSGYIPPGSENGLAIKYATNHKSSKFQDNEYDEFSFDSHSITSSSNYIHQPEYDPNINYQNPVTINNLPWSLSQTYPETPTYQYQPPWINNMIALPSSNISTPQMLISQPPPQHQHQPQQQPLSNNLQSRNRIDKIPPIYHHHSNIPQPHHHHHHHHPPPNQHQPYISSNMWPVESEYVQHYIQPPLPVKAASAPNSTSSGNIVVHPTYQHTTKMQQPMENTTQLSTSTSTTTNSNITITNTSSNTQENRNRRNLIQQSSSTSSDSSNSTPYYQNSQIIYTNHPNASKTSTPTPPNYQNGQEYIINIKDISPSHDIMSFTFLSSYGRITEGKLLHILSQDNNSTRISVQFVILPHTITTFSQLQQLHNSAIILDGISMTIVLEQKTQA